MQIKQIHINSLIALSLVVSGIVLFSRITGNSFISFDDPTYITENPYVRDGLTLRGLAWAFTTMYAENWHPLTWLSHMLDSQLFGLAPAGHHAGNVILHVANTVILYFLLAGITGQSLRSGFVAALFLVHPLHVESVAWASERKDVLCAFFSLLTIWAYVRFSARSSGRWYATSILLFIFALMSKPMAVTVPLLLLLLDWWPLGRLRIGTDHQRPGSMPEGKGTGRLVSEKIPFLVLTALSSVITYVAQEAHVQPISFPARMTNAFVSYASYLGKTVWPSGLSVYYPHGGDLIPLGKALLSVALFVVLSILAAYLAKRAPYLAFGWFWYVGTLVPVIGIIQVGAQSMADRYMYVPSIGLFIASSWGISDLILKWTSRKRVLPAGAAAALLALAAATWVQLGHWKNDMTLYHHAVDVDENNWIAQNTLGALLGTEGRLDEAIIHLSNAIRLNPGYAEPYFNLGVVYYRKGDRQEAVRYYREALRRDPLNTDRRMVLAGVLAELGMREEAKEEYREVLRIDQHNREAQELLRR
jgi:Tfp pilus assembly protein PilF